MRRRKIINAFKEIFKLPVLEGILAELTQNKTPDQFVAKFPPLYTSYPRNSIRNVKRKGINFELDISDYMEWLVYYGIQSEPKKNLYAQVRPNNAVLDVGANIGEVSLNMARIVGPLGTVHSFEPDPVIFAKFLKNCAINTFSNLLLNNFAIGDVCGEISIGAEVENNKGGTRVKPQDQKGVRVPISTIDTYVRDQSLEKVDMIKIDVEGFEVKVLLGAMNTLERFKPLLFIEVNDDNLKAQGNSAKELIDFLYQQGYRNIKHSESKFDLSSIKDFQHLHFDIIARYV